MDSLRQRRGEGRATTRRLTPALLAEDLAAAAARDRGLARALARFGPPRFRRREPGFAALLRIVIGQQLSTRAAGSIWARLSEAETGDPDGVPTPEGILSLDDASLRGAGLSGRKAEYARGLARDVVEGRLDLPRVHGLPDPEVVSALTAVRGLGVWSAEIYLLFALGRRDVFPAGDLGVRAALDRLGLVRGGRPDEDRARQVGSQRFAPYRSAVTLFLWHALDAPPLAPRR